MRLNSFEALNAFAAQLERHVKGGFHTKVTVTPSQKKKKGMSIKVSLLKSYIQTDPRGICASRTLRIRVSVAGTAESTAGLEQALEAIEALDRYLISPNLRLEAADAANAGAVTKVPNSRIIQAISQEDSFIDSPDSTAVQEVQDDRIVIITIPEGEKG
jgi:hypothetical protein